MAYDERLAARIRESLLGQPNLSEQKMFGGLAFLVGGNMAVGVSGEGGIMVRTDPAQTEQLVSEPAAGPMVMRGRPMSGWLRVSADALTTPDALAGWVDRGVAYASSLPVKASKRR